MNAAGPDPRPAPAPSPKLGPIAALGSALAIAFVLSHSFEGGYVPFAYPDPASPLAKATRGQPWGRKPAAEILAKLPSSVRQLRATPWTWCAGHTGRDYDLTRRYSPDECKALLESDLKIAQATVNRCLPMAKPVYVEGSLTDGVLNLGPKLVCGSTLQRKAQVGDWHGVCDELRRWNRAGGEVMAGLTRRRETEREVCRGEA